jgi:hypothetical protein
MTLVDCKYLLCIEAYAVVKYGSFHCLTRVSCMPHHLELEKPTTELQNHYIT